MATFFLPSRLCGLGGVESKRFKIASSEGAPWPGLAASRFLSSDLDMEDPDKSLPYLIGHITIYWNDLDLCMGDLAVHLATAIDFAYDDEEVREVFRVPFYQLDIRNKIAVNKALAIKATCARAPDLYEKTETLLNLIDNTLRPERNRFAHDSWWGLSRHQLGFAIRRPQSRKIELIGERRRDFPSREVVRSFRDHIIDALQDVQELDQYVVGLAYGSTPPSEPPEQLPTAWRSSTRRAWQDLDKP